jgi:hypothetical protein
MERNQDFRLSDDQADEALRQGIAAADPDRANGLGLLTRLLGARDAGLERERARLQRDGAAGGRIETLNRKLEASAVLNRAIGAEIKRIDRRPPRPNPDVWTLQGEALVDDPKFLSDKGVALVDEKGAMLGGSEADLQDGTFEIRYRVEPARPRAARAATRPKPGDASAEEPKEPAPADTQGATVFLAITDQRRVLYREARPLQARNGVVSYIEVDLRLPPATRTARERPAPPVSRPSTRPTQSRRSRSRGPESA